jgi:membrane-bound lytic murein transglycosylase B
MKLRVVVLVWLLALSAQVAASAGYAERDAVRAFIGEMQERHGFTAQELTAWFARAHAIPAVIKAIEPPAEPGVRSWQAYRSRFVETKRIAAGLRFWQLHGEALGTASERYGVPAEIIVAIIGIETIYGVHTGGFETFSALATLAFDYPPRAELFRRELEELLLLARDEKRDPLDYRGSYAGAIGLPQFLPSSVRRYAVDFDGSGGIDLLRSPTDAIGSVANFLKEHGWEAGGPVTVPVTVAGDRYPRLIENGITPRLTPTEMNEYGVSAPADAPGQMAALIDLVTPNQPTEYRLGYQNFFVLTRYNRSSFYAMAVYDLAQALAAARRESR